MSRGERRRPAPLSPKAKLCQVLLQPLTGVRRRALEQQDVLYCRCRSLSQARKTQAVRMCDHGGRKRTAPHRLRFP
ncbi:hypothetical protein NDU88_002968 [Pleurodeles waltl]|uniref:Uncharacterized protein n=1 Tax=Pleurodeles waltl TaxID=8319 RepID=A0AAV7NJE9_PLEWA|nr:hypothetical protein NDU88_002968 [Pleurodeles waltl]